MTSRDRSLKFYTEFFGLKVVARGDNTKYGGGEYVLLRDERSGEKLELNHYPQASLYGGPYIPGEGLDQIAFRVNDVDETLKKLAASGVKEIEISPMLTQPPGANFKVAYVQDPDENWIELYQHSEPIPSEIPEGY